MNWDTMTLLIFRPPPKDEDAGRASSYPQNIHRTSLGAGLVGIATCTPPHAGGYHTTLVGAVCWVSALSSVMPRPAAELGAPQNDMAPIPLLTPSGRFEGPL